MLTSNQNNALIAFLTTVLEGWLKLRFHNFYLIFFTFLNALVTQIHLFVN